MTKREFMFDQNQVGWLKINENTKIAVYKKLPNRFHRFMARVLLGWIYEEMQEESE